VEVDLGGVDPFVSEPEGDHGGVDAGVEELHRGGVAECVERDLLGDEARASLRCGAGVFGEAVFDESVAAELFAAGGREEWGFGLPGAFGEPDAQDGGCGGGQGRDPLFASFAAAGEVCAGGEVQIAAGEPCELGGSESGLGRGE